MTVQETIKQKISQRFQPLHMEVVNESGNHNVPAGSESHFKVTLVCRAFEGEKLIARHRMLNELLAEELAGEVHALSLHTLTPAEWSARGGDIRKSPPCLGGSKIQDRSAKTR